MRRMCESVVLDKKRSSYFMGTAFLVFLLLDSPPIFGNFKHWISATASLMAVATLPFLLINFQKMTIRYFVKPPFLFYFMFITLGIILSPFSMNTKTAIVYCAYYGIWAMFAIVLVENVSISKMLRIFQFVLALNIIASFAAHFLGIADGYFHGPGTLVPRFCGLMGNPNPMGLMCSIYMIVTLVFFSRTAMREWPTNYGWMYLLLVVATTPISMWILWESRSRSAMLALFAAVTLFLLIRLCVRVSAKNKRLIYGLPIILAGTTVWFIIQSLSTRNITDLSTIVARVDLYKFAWSKIMEHPLTGFGMGCSKFVLADFGRDWAICGAHNIILETTLYAGVLGGLLFVGFLLSSLYKLPRFVSSIGPDTDCISLLFLLYLVLSIVEPVILGVPRFGLLVFLICVASIVKANDDIYRVSENINAYKRQSIY